jgi:hypothetical protein
MKLITVLALCILLTSCYKRFKYNATIGRWETHVGRGRPFRSKKHPTKAKHVPVPFYNNIKLD